jgi:hypothetical protein
VDRLGAVDPAAQVVDVQVHGGFVLEETLVGRDCGEPMAIRKIRFLTIGYVIFV